MGMSPEQRAADLYELWSKRWNDDWCLNPDEFDALVAAIRAAEDEALEGAVGVLVGCWCDKYGGMTREEAEATSEVVLIRSLKSTPPEGK